LDGFDDYANGLYYAVYLLILGVMVKSKSIPHRIFLRNFFVVQLLFTLLLVKGLKYAVGEPRPYAGDIASQPFSSDRQFHSFPSGHTAESIAAASPLAYYIKVHLWLVLWGFLPASIAFCRLYFAQHDVFDVLGSVVIGLMSSYIVVTHTEKQVRVIEPPFVFTPFSLVGFKKNAKKIKT
jgi:membrane-associated phospholipid phosphatase